MQMKLSLCVEVDEGKFIPVATLTLDTTNAQVVGAVESSHLLSDQQYVALRYELRSYTAYHADLTYLVARLLEQFDEVAIRKV